MRDEFRMKIVEIGGIQSGGHAIPLKRRVSISFVVHTKGALLHDRSRGEVRIVTPADKETSVVRVAHHQAVARQRQKLVADFGVAMHIAWVRHMLDNREPLSRPWKGVWGRINGFESM